MKFYMTKDSFFLVNVYGKTRIFFACTLYYIMFFCAERHCGRNISERYSRGGTWGIVAVIPKYLRLPSKHPSRR